MSGTRGLDFGHSVGGAMALAAAAWHPARCRAVVTATAQAFVEPRTRAGIQAAKAAFGDPARFAKLAKWLRRPVTFAPASQELGSSSFNAC